MAATKATKFMVVAVLVVMLLLMSTEVATALGAATELKLGRRALNAEYNTDGRGGYNSYNTTGRGGYN
ncbi:hypothetical protein FH972_018346 [Carpinus fangiana]|uniref:Glycine-rich protein n=1 Tax=Carpinus fangiana TaxID=176857 RepID=A0A5N6RQ99_9ROSI|nr:hypothetical protein FH972_018346 [Carpinus fangiana]